MSGLKRRRLDTNSWDDRVAPPQSQHPVQLVDLLENYAVFDNLCSHLDVAGINTLRKVTKRWSRHLSAHLTERWNINKKLRRFVTDPKAFRSELGYWDALISGSFALQFFDGVVWEESDLDIFVEYCGNAIALGEYLVEKENYKSVKIESHEIYSMHDLVETQTYIRSCCGGIQEQPTKIQIVLTKGIPIQAILRGFYTTAVVNVITWNKAYSVFPDCTFLERKTYMLQPLDDWFGAQLVKYSSRGWMTLETQWEEDKKPTHSLQGTQRRVGDSHTWTIALNTDGVETSLTPDYVIEYACFSIENTELRQIPITNAQRGPWYNICAVDFESCVLNYRYTYAQSTENSFWIQMGARLDNLTKIEILKMPVDKQPAFFFPAHGMGLKFGEYHKNNYEFETTSSWVFYDDQIPKWHETWRGINNLDE